MTVVTIKQAGAVKVMSSGDWHVGSAEADYKALEKSVDTAIQEDMDVVLLGDILDTPTRTALTSPWEQSMSPREAYRYADNLLKKLQEKRKRVRVGVLGNHPWRVEKDSGLNPEEALYESNGIVSLRFSGVVHYILSDHNGGSVLYLHHTARGGRRAGAGVNAAEDLTDIVEAADVYLAGHSHRLGSVPIQRYHLYSSKKGDEMRARTAYLVNCGSFLKYEEGYGEQKQRAPLPIGTPLITLPERRDREQIQVDIRMW